MMPAKPATHFVVVETYFAFGFFKDDFDSLFANDKKVGEGLPDG